MERMKRKKYLWTHPTGRVYFRKNGKLLHSFTAPEGSEEFDRQYWEVMTGKKADAKRSWAALVQDYRKSDRWTGLKPRTRADYEKIMEFILEKIGKISVEKLTRADVIKAQRANLHRVRFANYIPQMFVILCEHAVDIGWIKSNPAKGVRAIKTPDAKKQEHVPWPDWAVAKFRAEASTLARLIFEIGVGTVQRPGDWSGFTWGDYEGQTLRLRQNKTDVPLQLPCTPQLKAVLDSAKANLPVTPIAACPILIKREGGAMSYRYIADTMLRERKRLGPEVFDLHALRYRGIMELAWADCSDEEIAAYSGHKTTVMVKKYAGEARQIMFARSAAAKRN